MARVIHIVHTSTNNSIHKDLVLTTWQIKALGFEPMSGVQEWIMCYESMRVELSVIELWLNIAFKLPTQFMVYKNEHIVILDHPYLEYRALPCVWDKFLLLLSYALLAMWECEITSKNTKYAQV